MIPDVRIVPSMQTYYIQPKTVEEMTYRIAAKLLEPFGIEPRAISVGRNCRKGITASLTLLMFYNKIKAARCRRITE